MDNYRYTGRNQRGELMRGSIESATPEAVAAWLMSTGIAPISITVEPDKLAGQPEWLRSLQRIGALKQDDLLLLTRQLGTMVRAGIPTMQALASIQRSTGNKALAEVMRDMRTDLDKGVDLSTAMSRHPQLFNDYYVNMVRVGENSGQLEEIFLRLFKQIEFEKNMRNKIKSALRYPSFVMIAIAAAIASVAVFVIPTFATLFKSINVELPLLTRILLGTSDFVLKYWVLIVAALAIGYYAVKLIVASDKGGYAWDRLKLRLPIVGSILKKAALARFCRSFATASRSGVPLVQTFTLVARVVDNAFYADRILTMREGVARGESILRVARTAEIFSPLELQMIAVGEETGDIEGMLTQVADVYQGEVEYEVARLGDAIEPILLAFMGVLVGILLLGIFQPLWEMTQLARPH